MKHNNGNSNYLIYSNGFYEEQFINTINGLLITDELEMLVVIILLWKNIMVLKAKTNTLLKIIT